MEIQGGKVSSERRLEPYLQGCLHVEDIVGQSSDKTVKGRKAQPTLPMKLELELG